ncbi:hypothetical protein L1049_021145 [Liquidambar formosana]|uniref:peptidylprolyl isomerase n=1 Tax=Liquidambar formosana TaxID=63359 RepID=A0AAP0SB02_LIQFO
MGFWGLEVKPGQPYPYQSDNVQRKLHITQATLGIGSSTKKSIVKCSVGEKSPILLCSLLPEKIESCPLNLEFEEDGLVSFSVIGPRSVHLSGFLEVNGRDSIGDDYESDSFGEDIAETETEESTDYDTEDGYDDDFIDDNDMEMFPPSPVPNSGVVIEEILEDEKPANGNNRPKRLKKKNQSSESEDNNNSQGQIVVKSGSGVPVLESEDEDGFPISAPHKSNPNVQKAEVEAEEKMDQKTTKETKKSTRDGGDDAKSLKRKASGTAQDGQPDRRADQPLDSSHPSTEVVPDNDVKQKKKKKKQKELTKEGQAHEAAGADNESDALPVSNEQVQKLADEKSPDIDADCVPSGDQSEEKKKKKKKKKSKIKESEGDVNMEQTVSNVGDTNGSTMASKEKKTEVKPSQVRTFPNGLVIEELGMGKPDGKRASPGKKVSVHYIGKLKKNGEIFDSNVGRAPFKFRLGVGQVIKGWDVGVNGMRIGDKRRLTIPPSMGYGARGAGGKIPPNAWLVFDVELVDVR